MDWLIYLFGSGVAFFLGVALIAVALALFVLSQRAAVKVLATLSAALGMVLVALSAAPLPYWWYGLAGVVTLLWLAAERAGGGWLAGNRARLRGAVAVVWAAAVAQEVPFHLSPSLGPLGSPKLYIIADSVSAGLDDRDKGTWPGLLARTHGIEVVDLSRVGATAASAMKQTAGLPVDGGLVLIEIGGNDLLGSTTAPNFERDLDLLLTRVAATGRTVVMFELPLPPSRNEYGRIQRRLASKYGVTLIPKRTFAAVLTGEGATLDSIHLAPAGHERMAAEVWAVIGGAYAD